MKQPKILTQGEREQLIQALHKRYGIKMGWKDRFIYLRKKYSWLIIVEGSKLFKRALDLFIAGSLLILLSPLILLLSVLIKFPDRGPILYSSNRVGKWGKEFQFYKFRTMCQNADKLKENLLIYNEYKDRKTFKMKKDPRITYLGAILRKTSLDELPQLWNVIKGEMSLVGPRPHLPIEVAKYTIEERRRLAITPGITCIWQVSGRSEIPFEEQMQLDLKYIESQSFWFDMKILLQTIPAVIFGKGAY